MKNLFFSIFDLFTSIGEKVTSGNPDIDGSSDFYYDYFQETSICSTLFGIGFIVALVAAVVFYYIICNKVHALANRIVWCVVLVLVGGMTYVLSISNIVGEDNDIPEQSSGVFYTAHNVTEPRLLDGTDDEEAREEIMLTAENYRSQFRTPEDSLLMEESLPYEMSGVIAFIAVILFIAFSLLITHVGFLRKRTIHGAGIPL